MITNSRTVAPALGIYPIELPVRYEIVTRDRMGSPRGQGLTVGIGSQMVRFRTENWAAVSGKVKLEMAWPASLPDGTGLNLWIHGRVIRSESSYVDVQVAKYEFRTRRSVQLAKTSLPEHPVLRIARFAGAGR